MNKQEYLKNRFKRDFLQYCLLQNDSLQGKAIAEEFYALLNLDWFTTQAHQSVDAICEEQLPFDKVLIDGKLSNELSQELGLDLADRMMADFQQHIDKYSTDEMAATITTKIERLAELIAWSNGVSNMSEAMECLLKYINNLCKDIETLTSAPISQDSLKDMYNKAKENTLLERINGSNVDDIIEYRSAMLEYVRAMCEKVISQKKIEVYGKITASECMSRLTNNFTCLLEYAQQLKTTLTDLTPNAEWDKEYNHTIPTDFFYRNVLGITAENAFHMILMHFFAKNEEWMKDNGLIVDGELKVYTGDAHHNIELIYNYLEETIK